MKNSSSARAETPAEDFRVFFAWQSTWPETNRFLIRDALKSAVARLKKKYGSRYGSIVVDEATRDMPGSPNVPLTIQQKIRAADAFLGDVTLTNPSASGSSRPGVPNPNVMFELGFAVSELGWDRVVIVCNTAFGRLEDIPFDVDRHRALGYSASSAPESEQPWYQRLCRRRKPATRGGGTDPGDGRPRLEQLQAQHRKLFDGIYEALDLIIKKDPARPAELGVPVEVVRRHHDVRVLERFARHIHWPTLRHFLETAPQRYGDRVLASQAALEEFVDADFFLHDSELEEEIRRMSAAWDNVLGYASSYVQHAGGGYFTWPLRGDIEPSDHHESRALQRATDAVGSLRQARDRVLEILRARYPEVDLEKGSAQFWDRMKALERRYEFKGEDE